MKSLRINKLQFILGFIFLLAGTLEYVFSRPPGSAYFLIPFHSVVVNLHDKFDPFGALGFLAPDFFHPLAFALMCMAVLKDALKNRLAICLSWFVIDTLLEIAQKDGLTFINHVPDWFASIPLIRNYPGYLVHGTFDVKDLLAITMGTLMALFIGQLTTGGRYEKRSS